MTSHRGYEYLDCILLDNGNWKVTGNYPTIKIPENSLSPGWVNLRFDYEMQLSERRDPMLSFETHGVKRRIRLELKNDHYINHVFKLPESASEVSIELLGLKGSFLLSAPEFRRISQISAMKSILLGLLTQQSRHSLKRAFLLAKNYLKNYGARALIQRIVDVSRQGTGKNMLVGESYAAYEDFQQDWALSEQDFQVMGEAVKQFSSSPLISLIMPVFDPEENWLTQAIDSVICQSYSNWELCVADDASNKDAVREILDEYSHSDSRIKVIKRSENGHISAASNSALSLATGDWVAFLDHDDLLHPAALFCVAKCLQKNPHIKFIYTDEDRIDLDGKKFNPYFKPDYNPSLFTSQNYFNHLSALKKSLIEELGGFRLGYEGAQDYDLFLRYIERIQPEEIFHIPFPLYSWRMNHSQFSNEFETTAEDAGVLALNDHYQRIGQQVHVSKGVCPTTYRSKRAIPDSPPKVSIIIPTRDGGDYLDRCLSSLYKITVYPNFETIVVNNGSTDQKTLKILEEFEEHESIRVFDKPGSFNFSALNNFGVENSQGDFVCLLNDDTEIVSEDWLDELVSQLFSPRVGVVGAKLLYPDLSIQHAGIVTGISGIAGHGHKHATSSEDGYFYRLRVVHDVGAVTGACLLTTRKLWKELKGLDEDFLKVNFNDVDFCLRARSLGFRVVWTPYAELIHHESKSRGLDISNSKKRRLSQETETMKRRWGDFLLDDPAYSPNLSLDTERFEISKRSRSVPLWRLND